MNEVNQPDNQCPTQRVGDLEFIAIINCGSGSVQANHVIDKLKFYASQLNVIRIHLIDCEVDDPAACIAKWIAQAAQAQQAVIVAGGDGTICLAVNYALQESVPLAILAMGTFNLFARHHNLSTDPATQIQQLLQCELTQVSICYANDQPFTTSASFGLYPEVIEDREHYQFKIGFRSRFTGYFAGLVTFFKDRPSSRFILEDNGASKKLKSLVLMVTQNRPHLLNLGFNQQALQIDGSFAVINVNPKSWRDKLRLLMKGSVRLLHNDEAVSIEFKQSIRLNTKSGKILKCVLDGEIVELQTPVQLEVKAQALSLFKPAVQAIHLEGANV